MSSQKLGRISYSDLVMVTANLVLRMPRQEILDQFEQNFGLVPDFLREMPEPILEQYSNTLNWVTSDTTLSARDKALVAFGAASAIHCAY
jgi:alkylhydroperoxidase/carboxymuconolactone decarboxylase family protein YurZ